MKAKTAKKRKEERVLEAKIPVYNLKGKEVESFPLDKDIFTGAVNRAALYQAVLEYNANQRRGGASTKTISDVSGGGRKPWRQKGTGRARHASIRSPIWRGGGIIFGPHPRDYHYRIPKKVRRLALVSALNAKLRDKELKGLEALAIPEPKTKRMREVLKALQLSGRTLFVVDTLDDMVARASRNMREVMVRTWRDFNTMDVLVNDTVVVTKAALEKLKERLGKR